MHEIIRRGDLIVDRGTSEELGALEMDGRLRRLFGEQNYREFLLTLYEVRNLRNTKRVRNGKGKGKGKG